MRLTVLQYIVIVDLLGARRELLGAAGGAAREIRGDGREQPSANARPARAARHHLRSQRPGARREPEFLQHLDRPRAHEGHQPTIRLLAAVLGLDEAGVRRSSIDIAASRHTGRSRSSQDATLAQVAAVTARRLDFELPDVLVRAGPDAAISARRWRRICSAMSAK